LLTILRTPSDSRDKVNLHKETCAIQSLIQQERLLGKKAAATCLSFPSSCSLYLSKTRSLLVSGIAASYGQVAIRARRPATCTFRSRKVTPRSPVTVRKSQLSTGADRRKTLRRAGVQDVFRTWNEESARAVGVLKSDSFFDMVVEARRTRDGTLAFRRDEEPGGDQIVKGIVQNPSQRQFSECRFGMSVCDYMKARGQEAIIPHRLRQRWPTSRTSSVWFSNRNSWAFRLSSGAVPYRPRARPNQNGCIGLDNRAG